MAEKEYIEREAAINAMCRLCSDTTREKCRIADICNHVCRLEAVPAADVRPVVRGVWGLQRENQNGDNWDRWVCSKCGFVAAKGWEHTRYGAKPKYNFCPNCGADMRAD